MSNFYHVFLNILKKAQLLFMNQSYAAFFLFRILFRKTFKLTKLSAQQPQRNN